MKKILTALLLLLVLVPGALAIASPDLLDSNDVSATSYTVSGNPGTTADVTFKVKNQDPTLAINLTFPQFTLTESSSGQTIVTSNPAVTAIPNLAANTVSNAQTLSIVIPAGKFAGDYTGTFTVQQTEDANVKYEVPITLTVNPIPDLSGSLSTITVARSTTSQNFEKQGTLTLTNAGNTDLSGVTLTINNALTSTGGNSLGASNIQFSESSGISIPFTNNQKTITVTVSADSTTPLDTYTGAVTVNFGGTTTKDVPITVVVRADDHNLEITGDTDFGSSSQKRDNSTIEKTITIKNTGDYTETVNLDVSNIASKFNPQLDTTTISSLAPDGQQQVKLTLTVPNDANSGKSTLGQLTAKFNSDTETVTKSVTLETKNYISIDDIDVEVGDERDTNLNDGDDISDEASPGDDIVFKIDIKNLFDDNIQGEDQELDNVEVTVTIEDLDDGDDFDETSDVDDIKPDKTKSADSDRLTFSVPTDADEDKYTVVIEVTGDDEDNNRHTATATIYLTVEKENDDVRIERADLGSTTLQCLRSTSLSVELENYGSDDQDDVRLTVTQQDFSIQVDEDDIEIDEGDDYSRRVTVNAPESLSAGEYDIEIRAYYDRRLRDLADEETVRVTVKDCADTTSSDNSSGSSTGSTSGSTSTTGTTDTTTPTTGATGTVPTGTTPVETFEQSLTNSPVFIALLVLLNVIALGGVVVLAVKLLK